jgi:CO/xanthine dehydrogenase Mo-binding subunit
MGQFGIGQPVRRFEDRRFLRGEGRFQNDVNLPGQAHAVVLRSPHAHARIRTLDLAAAKAAPGVLAVYTGDDLAAAGLGTMGVPLQRKRPDGSPMFTRPHLGLAQGKVRFVGEPMAFIVAETLAEARDAAELVAIDYEILESVTDTAEAAEGKVAVWDECPDNISNLFEAGNEAATDAAFTQAAHIVRRKYVISRVYAHFMEPRGAIGTWDPGEDRFTLYADVQYPHRVRQALATRIVKPETSDKMRYLMRLNVEKGTATRADVKGYYVGGKTGTSEKVVAGRYSKTKVLTTFTAVLPADAPRYALLIMLDEPQPLPETQGFATSGWNAVPVGGAVISRIAPLLGLEPRFDLAPSDKLILAAAGSR